MVTDVMVLFMLEIRNIVKRITRKDATNAGNMKCATETPFLVSSLPSVRISLIFYTVSILTVFYTAAARSWP